MPHNENPGWRAGASRDLLGGWSQHLNTLPDLHWQCFAQLRSLPLSMAKPVMAFMFGEAFNARPA